MIGNFFKRQGKLSPGNFDQGNDERTGVIGSHVRFPNVIENNAALFEDHDYNYDYNTLGDHPHHQNINQENGQNRQFSFISSDYQFEEVVPRINSNDFFKQEIHANNGFQNMIDNAFKNNLPSSFRAPKRKQPINDQKPNTNPDEIFQNNVKEFEGHLKSTAHNSKLPILKEGFIVGHDNPSQVELLHFKDNTKGKTSVLTQDGQKLDDVLEEQLKSEVDASSNIAIKASSPKKIHINGKIRQKTNSKLKVKEGESEKIKTSHRRVEEISLTKNSLNLTERPQQPQDKIKVNKQASKEHSENNEHEKIVITGTILSKSIDNKDEIFRENSNGKLSDERKTLSNLQINDTRRSKAKLENINHTKSGLINEEGSISNLDSTQTDNNIDIALPERTTKQQVKPKTNILFKKVADSISKKTKLKIEREDNSQSKQKQVLFKSEDVSVDLLNKKQQKRLPKKFRQKNKENEPPVTVELPNFGNIQDFATVIEKNDTEGKTVRTVIIKNTPEALQAFKIRNAPKVNPANPKNKTLQKKSNNQKIHKSVLKPSTQADDKSVNINNINESKTKTRNKLTQYDYITDDTTESINYADYSTAVEYFDEIFIIEDEEAPGEFTVTEKNFVNGNITLPETSKNEETDAETFNPLRKLKQHLSLKNDTTSNIEAINPKIENLQTLFYEDFSQEIPSETSSFEFPVTNSEDSDPIINLIDNNYEDIFQSNLTAPEVALDLDEVFNTGNIADNIDFFDSLEEIEEARNPKEFTSFFTTDNRKEDESNQTAINNNLFQEVEFLKSTTAGSFGISNGNSEVRGQTIFVGTPKEEQNLDNPLIESFSLVKTTSIPPFFRIVDESKESQLPNKFQASGQRPETSFSQSTDSVISLIKSTTEPAFFQIESDPGNKIQKNQNGQSLNHPILNEPQNSFISLVQSSTLAPFLRVVESDQFPQIKIFDKNLAKSSKITLPEISFVESSTATTFQNILEEVPRSSKSSDQNFINSVLFSKPIDISLGKSTTSPSISIADDLNDINQSPQLIPVNEQFNIPVFSQNNLGHQPSTTDKHHIGHNDQTILAPSNNPSKVLIPSTLDHQLNQITTSQFLSLSSGTQSLNPANHEQSNDLSNFASPSQIFTDNNSQVIKDSINTPNNNFNIITSNTAKEGNSEINFTDLVTSNGNTFINGNNQDTSNIFVKENSFSTNQAVTNNIGFNTDNSLNAVDSTGTGSFLSSQSINSSNLQENSFGIDISTNRLQNGNNEEVLFQNEEISFLSSPLQSNNKELLNTNIVKPNLFDSNENSFIIVDSSSSNIGNSGIPINFNTNEDLQFTNSPKIIDTQQSNNLELSATNIVEPSSLSSKKNPFIIIDSASSSIGNSSIPIKSNPNEDLKFINSQNIQQSKNKDLLTINIVQPSPFNKQENSVSIVDSSIKSFQNSNNEDVFIGANGNSIMSNPNENLRFTNLPHITQAQKFNNQDVEKDTFNFQQTSASGFQNINNQEVIRSNSGILISSIPNEDLNHHEVPKIAQNPQLNNQVISANNIDNRFEISNSQVDFKSNSGILIASKEEVNIINPQNIIQNLNNQAIPTDDINTINTDVSSSFLTTNDDLQIHSSNHNNNKEKKPLIFPPDNSIRHPADNNVNKNDKLFSATVTSHIPVERNKNSFIIKNVHDSAVTASPMEFQSASGRIRMPVTFQYGFEPMTVAPPTPISSLSITSSPVKPAKKLMSINTKGLRNTRPRRTNVVEFYQQPSVLDQISGLLSSVSNSFKAILN